MFNKTLLKLDLVYCREVSPASNAIIALCTRLVTWYQHFFSLIKYLPQEKKYLNVSQRVLLELFPSRANAKT